MRDLRRRRQGGSVLILVAAMSLVLIAFVGLSVDGGEIEAQQRQSQNAADGAALAAATAVINADNYGYTTSDANSIGVVVAGYNGIPTSDLTLSFLDSTGSATTVPANVVTVKAVVNHTFPTLFLPVMNIDSASVSAQAAVTITQAPPGCSICVMSATASPAANTDSGGQISASGGPISVLSAGSPAINVSGGGSISTTGTPQPAVTSVGSVSGSTSPAASSGAGNAFTDPLISVPYPTTLGATATNTTYSTTTTISPGTYGSLTITGGGTVTMSPGLYIIAGGLTVNGGATLNGSGVTLFFTCTDGLGHSALCATPTDPGDLTITGTMTVSAPASGSTYTGLVMFGDRNDTATISIPGTLSPTGTTYAPAMNLNIGHGDHEGFTGRTILGTIDVENGGRLTVTYTQSGNYVAPGKLQMTT